MFPKLEFWASAYHSGANFYPCPDNLFNYTKMNCGAKDFLCLMVGIMEECIEQGKRLVLNDRQNTTVDIETLIIWKRYLVDNREKVCLEDEFIYNHVTDKMIGNSLFEGQ